MKVLFGDSIHNAIKDIHVYVLEESAEISELEDVKKEILWELKIPYLGAYNPIVDKIKESTSRSELYLVLKEDD